MSGFLITYPITIAQLAAIEAHVASAEVLIAHFSDEPKVVYSIRTYLEQLYIHETPCRLFVDRQIISYLKQLATGSHLAAPERKLCAAIMCFAILAKIEIEPNIGLYEYADTNGDEQAWRDLCIVRHADNVDFNHYHSIFLGLTDSLPIGARFRDFQLPPQEHSFVKRLKYFSFSYSFLLKIALLANEPNKPVERMFRYLDWMYNDYLFGAPAVLFGNIFLSPSRTKRMIKNINSEDREERLAGIRNAAWDLTFIQHWLKYLKTQQNSQHVWIACSNDKIVARIARLCLATDDASDQGMQARVRHILIETWGPINGSRIHIHYEKLSSSITSRTRPNRNFTATYMEELQKQLESQI